MYLLYVVDQSNTCLKELVNKVREKSAISLIVPNEKVIDEVSQSHEFKLTGYGLFKLEKSLIIGSFTILFIQITSM